MTFYYCRFFLFLHYILLHVFIFYYFKVSVAASLFLVLQFLFIIAAGLFFYFCSAFCTIYFIIECFHDVFSMFEFLLFQRFSCSKFILLF